MIDVALRIRQSAAILLALSLDEGLRQALERAVGVCVAALDQGGKILFCGNGGSAADAQHLAAELSGRFYFDRSPLYAEALHTNTSYLTAVANDYGYDQVFSRQIAAKGRRGDVLVGISTSGNSPNVALAMETAARIGLTRIAMTGQSGGRMAALTDILLAVPSTDTPRIQESHILLGHILCEAIEATLFPPGSGR